MPKTSEMELVGRSPVLLMYPVDEVPGVKKNQPPTKMRLQKHGDGDKGSWAVTKNRIWGSVGNLNQ